MTIGQPGLPGSQFPGPDDTVRRLRALEDSMQMFAAANILATAGLGAVTDGVLVNGFMEFKREDGTRGLRVDPVTRAFSAYDATGDAEVARFGALQSADGEYGVEVKVGDTWVQLGAQVATWDNLAGRPGTIGGATLPGSIINSAVAQANNAARADRADGVTPEAFNREVAGVAGSWYAMYMHSNGTFGRGTSSIRYKRNVRPYALTADQLLNLRAVIYDRKAKDADDYTPPVSTDEVGLIAEEVEQVAPELVEYFDGIADNVKYERLVVGLLPVIQDQQQTIEHQASQIALLTEAVRKLGGEI